MDQELWFKSARRGDLEGMKNNWIPIYNINCQEEKTGETALMMATYNNHTECVRWLISQIKDKKTLDIQDKTNETALIKAARIGNDTCIRLLLDNGSDMNLEGFRQLTALMNAVCNGHTECAETLIDRGASLNIVDDLGSTALIKAAYAGNHVLVEKLVKSGALLNVTDNNGQTALIKVAEKGDLECIKLLVENGAHVNITDKSFCTPLLKLASSWNLHSDPEKAYESVRLLCFHGSYLDMVDCNNETALMKAAAYGFEDSVYYLLNKMAEVNVFNGNGQTALMLAAKHGHIKVLKKLVELDDVLKMKNVADLAGYTAIMHAACNSHSECVGILAKIGVDVDVVDNKGMTPLMLMAEKKCEKVIKILIDAGADIGRKNKEGKSANDLAGNSIQTLRLV